MGVLLGEFDPLEATRNRDLDILEVEKELVGAGWDHLGVNLGCSRVIWGQAATIQGLHDQCSFGWHAGTIWAASSDAQGSFWAHAGPFGLQLQMIKAHFRDVLGPFRVQS